MGKGSQLYGDGCKLNFWWWACCSIYRSQNIMLYAQNSYNVINHCYLNKKQDGGRHEFSPPNLYVCTYTCKDSLQRKRLFFTAVSHLCHSSCCKVKFFLSIFSWTNILTKYKVGFSSTFANTVSCNCCRKINTSLTGCSVWINIQQPK